MQQNNNRTFLPAPRATIEPPVDNVVLRERARSRRGKAKVSRVSEFKFCRRAFDRDKVRPFQELQGFLQLRIVRLVLELQQGFRPPAPHQLDGQPIQQFGQRRDHVLALKEFLVNRKINRRFHDARYFFSVGQPLSRRVCHDSN